VELKGIELLTSCLQTIAGVVRRCSPASDRLGRRVAGLNGPIGRRRMCDGSAIDPDARSSPLQRAGGRLDLLMSSEPGGRAPVAPVGARG